MTGHDLPNLAAFLGTSYHEDWTVEAGTSLEVAERYAREASAQTRDAVVRELDQVLTSSRAEEQLEQLVAELGCLYDPRADGTTVRGWLEQVRRIMATK